MVNNSISLTIADACQATGIGRTSLYGLVAEGKLDARKSGAGTLIVAESFRRYMGQLEPTKIGASPSERG